jgi:hypothetical protein
MKNKLSDLNNHMFEAIEMLKNNSDPEASPNEKMDLETAKRIADLGKIIIEGAKVQVQAIGMMAKSDNLAMLQKTLENNGVIDKSNQKAIE